MAAQISMTGDRAQSTMLGLGVYRPDRVVTNAEICETIDSTDEWIRTRSGIRSRRFAAEGENVLTMSVRAGQEALAAAGVEAAQLGAVIVATSTHWQQTPPAACIVADALGTGGASAFDLGAGCAGFCYALGGASDLVRAGTEEYVLVIGAEHLSATTRPDDRSVRFIFADGAGAVVVGRSENAGIGPVVWGSDGSHADAIRQTPDWYEFANNPDQERPWIEMDGMAVFRWAAFEMGKVAMRALERASLTTEDLDVFIPHQANSRINEVIARSVHLPDSVPMSDDIAETGNTSAASIPLAMEEVIRTGKASAGDTALLVGFGAGLSYAGQVVTLPPLRH